MPRRPLRLTRSLQRGTFARGEHGIACMHGTCLTFWPNIMLFSAPSAQPTLLHGSKHVRQACEHVHGREPGPSGHMHWAKLSIVLLSTHCFVCRVACFNLDEFESAKEAFETALALDPKASSYKTWIRKCDAELEGKHPVSGMLMRGFGILG